MRYAGPDELSSAAAVGGKAFNLARLADVGPVPDFLVLVGDTGATGLPVDLHDRLAASGEGALFAVRSSATAEDSADASFAGLFETRLGVCLDEIPAAVAEVMGSVSSSRVDSYLEAHGRLGIRIEMAVVIQHMVDSEVAGVCLSRFSRDDERALVEAVWGLGEQLVSGETAPDRYVVEPATGTVDVQAIAYQGSQLRLGPSGPRSIDVPAFDRNAQKLEAEQALAVAGLARRIEQVSGWASADVEFAFDTEGLQLLQARPFAGYAAAPASGQGSAGGLS